VQSEAELTAQEKLSNIIGKQNQVDDKAAAAGNED